MPSPVTTSGGTAQTTRGGQAAAPVATVPFVRASQLHRESILDRTVTMTASDQDQGAIPIPAYGYLRSVLIQVTTSGSAGAATFSEDGPWNLLKNILLQEPNGATIAQFNSGYEVYLVDKYGGYRGFNDPKNLGAYLANAANGAFSFFVRIPVELNVRDALGSLPNQNAAAAFQLRFVMAASTTVYSAVPATTLPNVRFRIWAEEWDQPDLSTDGAPNQTTPPVMNTTQFFSVQTFPIAAAGVQTIRLTRMGNYIRNWIFIYRAATRAAGETDWPDVTLYWDTRPLDFVNQSVWRTQMYERGGYAWSNAQALDAVNGQDSGVYVYDFAHEFDGVYGHENRDLWLPTLGSTRFEIQGNFGAAGNLTVITNDVSVAGNVFL